jgi:AFG3 family protein
MASSNDNNNFSQGSQQHQTGANSPPGSPGHQFHGSYPSFGNQPPQQPQAWQQFNAPPAFGGPGQFGGGGFGGNPGFGAPQPQYGGFAAPLQFGQPQFGQPQFAGGLPPPPPQFSAAPATAAVIGAPADNDYFKGFYEGANRPTSSRFGSAMSWIGPIVVNTVLFVGPLWWMRRRYMQTMKPAVGGKDGGKGGMGAFMDMMNPLKPKQYRVEVKNTKFNDVIGIPEAKEDLKQYVDFLADPKKFTRLGARLPKGCLLTGQPGTGKTLIAKAIAGEANRPFLTCSGADFIEIFGGSGPKRVRELFAEAKECAPCVVFIDEIDAIGTRNSGRSMGGGSSEENRTINQLLAELDGLSSNQAVVVVAATNFPENIDKALLREGRFDRKVNVPMPDLDARKELFNFYLKKVVTGDPESRPKIQRIRDRKKDDETDEQYAERMKKFDEEAAEADKKVAEAKPVVIEGVSNKVYASELADRTPGVSPAQIATIVNEAALTCAVAGAKSVDRKALHDAIDDVLIGKKHRQRMSDSSLKRTAYHECGHAMMAWFNPLQKDVVKISIIPRGRAGGYTQQIQDEAMDPQTNTFLFSQLCVLLGGRVAERIILGDISTGAVDDLQRATKVAMDQLLSFGMSEGIGHLAFKPVDKTDGRQWMTYSEDLHARVEQEARKLVDKAYDHTVKTLTENKEKLHELATTLLDQKELMRGDVESILGARPTKPSPAQPVQA